MQTINNCLNMENSDIAPSSPVASLGTYEFNNMWDPVGDQKTTSCFVTSTPNVAVKALDMSTRRKSGRRSWFDNTRNHGTKLEISFESDVSRSIKSCKKANEEEIETLLLTHFSNPPKVGFGNFRVGKSKSRIIVVKNPHEHPQSVKIERFPHKNNFKVDKMEFVVGPEDNIPLTVTWSPQEAGNCREMILFLVDGVYRLQLYVFGCADPAPKKRKQGKGILGSRAKKPFSVIQTPSLANIQHAYSTVKGNDAEYSFESLGLKKSVAWPKPNVTTVGRENQLPCGISSYPAGIIPSKLRRRSKTYTKHMKNTSIENSVEAETPDESSGHGCIATEDICSTVTTTCTVSTTYSTSTVQSDVIVDSVNKSLSLRDDTDKDSVLGVPLEELSPIKTDGSGEPASSVQDSFCVYELAADRLSPDSFLHESLLYQKRNSTCLADLIMPCKPPKKSDGNTGDCIKVINSRGFLSPETFLKDLSVNKTGQGCSKSKLNKDVPSPQFVLNDSIPHELIVKQLRTVKTRLSDPSLNQVVVNHRNGMKSTVRQITKKTGTDKISKRRTGDIKDDTSIQRTTFLVKKKTTSQTGINKTHIVKNTAQKHVIARVQPKAGLLSRKRRSLLHKANKDNGKDRNISNLPPTTVEYSTSVTKEQTTFVMNRCETVSVLEHKPTLNSEGYDTELDVETVHQQFSQQNLEKGVIGIKSDTVTKSRPNSLDHPRSSHVKTELFHQEIATDTKSCPIDFIGHTNGDSATVTKSCHFNVQGNSDSKSNLFHDHSTTVNKTCSEIPTQLGCVEKRTVKKQTSDETNIETIQYGANKKLFVDTNNLPSIEDRILCVSPSEKVSITQSVCEDHLQLKDNDDFPGGHYYLDNPYSVLSPPLMVSLNSLFVPEITRQKVPTFDSTPVTLPHSPVVFFPHHSTYVDSSLGAIVPLPTSPNPDMSQKSTLTWDKPKVVNQSNVEEGSTHLPIRAKESDVLQHCQQDTHLSLGMLALPANSLDLAVVENISLGTPETLPSSPKPDMSRRSTHTVDKPRFINHSDVGRKQLFQSVTKESNVPQHSQQDTHLSLGMLALPANSLDLAVVENISLGTPETLPSSPKPDMSRRSTHTVDKPRFINHSDVGRKQLFQPVTKESDVPQHSQQDTHLSLGMLALPANSLDLAVVKNISLGTPETLPSSPKPDMSRRSTHTVDKPRVIIHSDVGRKQLFQPVEEGISSSCEHLTREKKGLDAYPTAVSSLPLTPTVSRKIDNPSSVCSFTVQQSSGNQFLKDNCDNSDYVEMNNRTIVKPGGDGRKRVRDEQTGRKEVFAKGKTEQMQKRHKAESQQKMVSKRSTLNTKGVGQTARKIQQPAAKSRGPLKGVAMSKLILVKKPKSALPKHPLPFAAKNMYYDERWLDKQERGFVNWLNFILTPAAEYQNTNTKVKVDAGRLCMDSSKYRAKLAPTKEILSFRAYAVNRRLNHLRRFACQLFQSEPVVRIIHKVEAEVESLRIAVRKDKMLHADLGIKQSLLDILMSYNPLWLRIGIETIFGEVIPLQSNNDVIGLSHFILLRLLGSPDIQELYAHPTVPHLYSDGYGTAMSQHILKKFLLLVFFLDRAKATRLICHDPCLFCKDSDVKSSKEMLYQFSRDYLSGEGDIIKHLAYLGYRVSHTQLALEEFDYAVTNLANDLRDGLRLVRTFELLDSTNLLTRKLRVPAISRLQKVHNVEIIFAVLKERRVSLDYRGGIELSARDVVNGHREKTLALLWKIVLNYQVDVLLDRSQMLEEIKSLEQILKLRQQLSVFQNLTGGSMGLRRQSAEPELHLQNEKLGLLLRWCRAVCAFYKLKIENFTVSFSDGRALCYILHHYHPALLPLKFIKTETTMTYLEEMEAKGYHDLSASFGDTWSPTPYPDAGDSDEFEALLLNERENFKQLYEKVSELGGVPLMLKSVDMSNTIPDEKVVVTYLCYLCARLMDIRHESHAARIIQMAWRRRCVQKAQIMYQEKTKAAVRIQQAVRMFLKRKELVHHESAALKIQNVWRYFLRQKKNKCERDRKLRASACVIQAVVLGFIVRRRFKKMQRAVLFLQAIARGYLCRKQMQKENSAAKVVQNLSESEHAAVKMQAAIRMFLARRKYQAILTAVSTLQHYYRSYCRMMECYNRYSDVRTAAIVIQSVFRMWKCRHYFFKVRYSAIIIQSYYRMHLKKNDYQKQRRAAIIIQSYYRMHLKRNDYQKQRRAAIIIQSYYRMHLKRNDYQKQRRAAIIIQSYYRMHLKRNDYQKQRRAAIIIQSYYRMHLKKNDYQKQRRAAIIIQSYYRMHLKKNDYQKQRRAAIIIQSYYRMHLKKNDYQKQRRAAIIIQSYYRMHLKKNDYQKQRRAAIIIQSYYRMHLKKNDYQKQRRAAIIIQSYYRMHLKKNDYQKQRRAAIIIQSYYRMHLKKNDYQKQRRAAIQIEVAFGNFIKVKEARLAFLAKLQSCIILQSYMRRAIAKNVACKERAARKIQSWYRGHVQRNKYHKMKNAAILLQRSYRMHLARHQYIKKRYAASKLQLLFRARQKGRREYKEFLIKKGAAITIQSVYRGYLVRRQYNKQFESAVLIQAWIRMWQARMKYHKWIDAVVCLQTYYYAWRESVKERQNFLMKRQSAITIQACFRVYLCRKSLNLANSSATSIQAMYRMHIWRRNFHAVRFAAICVQRYYRQKLLTKQFHEAFLKKKRAAIIIQASFKGYKERTRYAKVRHNMIQLQAFYRMHCQRKRFERLRTVVICLQRLYRYKLQTVKYHSEYLLKKESAIRIQTFFRGYRARKHYQSFCKASVQIQSMLRMYHERKHHLALKTATVALQRCYRSKLEMTKVRRNFLKKKAAAICIQAAFRGYRARKSYRAVCQALVKVQSFFRMYRERKCYQNLKAEVEFIQRHYRRKLETKRIQQYFLVKKGAAITIQAAYKGYRARLWYIKMQELCICLQSYFRMYLERRRYQVMRHTATTLQRIYKQKLEAQKIRRNFLIRKGAAVIIQAYVKGYQAVQRYAATQKAIVKIQALCRMYCVRKHFTELREAAIVLQTWIRRKQKTDQLRREFCRKKQSACKIQAAFRGYMVRKLCMSYRSKVVLVQTVFRGYCVRKQFLDIRRAVVCVQRWYRQTLDTSRTRREFLNKRQSAVTIQAAWRGALARKQYRQRKEQRDGELREKRLNRIYHLIQIHLAAIIIQRWFRKRQVLARARQHLQYILLLQRWFRACIQRKLRLKMWTSIVAVQLVCRQWLKRRLGATVVIQAAVRGWIARRCFNQKIEAAVKIQAVWRGCAVRSKNKHKKIDKLRKRIKKVSDAATEDKKLGNRTTSALDYLLKYKQLAYILEALMHLDVSTRLSPLCCERMAEVNAIQVIYRLVQSCNRSIPHMELIKYSVNILLNLAKYEKTVEAVYAVEGAVSILVDLMQVYREKGAIFSKTCTLLGILAMHPARRMTVLADMKVVDRLRSIYMLTVRKHKIDESRMIKCAKLAAVKSFNSSLQVFTPTKHHKIRPEWVLKKDKLNEISDPLQAIEFVMSNLHLRYQ